MKLKSYPAYKDSGVEWLGNIPQSWVKQKTSWVYKIGMGSTILAEDLIDDGDMPVFSATEGDHYFGFVNISRVVLSSGDLVVPARGNSIGNTKLVDRPSTCTQTTIYLKPINNRILSKFAYWFFKGCKEQLFGFTNTAIPQLTTDEVSKNPILIPCMEEQIPITIFLDRETAKLDTLISKQERLIELLQEKRQAIISHAVTKGLDPDVQMKDSGVEWLGEVPNHWQVSSFKRIINIQNGADHKHIEVEDLDSGYPVVGSGGIFAYASDYMFDGPSVLLGRKGTIDKPLFLNCKFWTVDTMYWSKIRDGYDPKFAYYVALNIPFDYYSTSTALPSMTKSLLGSHIVAIPNLAEQIQISNYLDDQNSKIDTLIDKARQSIELAKEHRTALISAAVTGKIDVREAA